MNLEIFALTSAMCFSNYSGQTCTKTTEAALKYEGMWNYAEQLGKYAKEISGEVPAYIAAMSYEVAKEKKIRLTTHGNMCYTVEVSKDSGVAKITWKIW